MKWDDARLAFEEATQKINTFKMFADTLADMLCGNLRNVSSYRLKKLKRELQEFNAVTGRWKS